jgi:hypothetical protein
MRDGIMGIDLSRFKVVYDEKVLKALSLQEVVFQDSVDWEDRCKKPNLIEILVINDDGNIEVLRDEAWMFQFIPILSK